MAGTMGHSYIQAHDSARAAFAAFAQSFPGTVMLIGSGAPVDGFGVGTAMGVSADVPAFDIAYKLTAYAGRGRIKLSTAWATLPGRKQVLRQFDAAHAAGDVIARSDEILPAKSMLLCVMKGGRRLSNADISLDSVHKHARQSLKDLPAHLLSLSPAALAYLVTISAALSAEVAALRSGVAQHHLDPTPTSENTT